VGVYAYCVLPATHPPPASLTGLDATPVAVVKVEDLLVWVSYLERPQPSVEAVQAHNRVVEAAITEEVTPVPLRFGQWLEDESALRAAIAPRAADYRQKLQQFAGCLEFGLRLIDPKNEEKARDVHTSPATSGFEYMQALRESSRLAEQARQHAEQVRARVLETLHDLVHAERVQEERTAHSVLTVSHLVARPNFDEYRARARHLRTVFPAMRLLVSGPWPPYSFAA
jgi:hypothetical protein